MGSTSGEWQLPARREAAHLFHFQHAADQGRWADAVAALERLLEAAADYPSAAQRLEQARARRQVADLQADLRRRHKARQWAAVLAASEQLTALDPAAADPDGTGGGLRMFWVIDSALVGVIAEGSDGTTMDAWFRKWAYVVSSGD